MNFTGTWDLEQGLGTGKGNSNEEKTEKEKSINRF